MEWGTEHAVQLPRLVHLFKQFCKYYTIQPDTQQAMLEILNSPTVAALLELPEEEWSSVLVNDLYKAGMHKTYATFLSGVSADFALQVRRSPVTLACMARQRPKLFQALQERVDALRGVQPYSPEVQHVLMKYADGFLCTQEMLERATRQGVAPVSWQAGHLPTGELADVCIASGPIESASHAETTVLQLVQAAIIRFQVEELREQHGLSRPSNGYQSEPAASAQQRPQEPTASAQQRPQKEPAASAQQQPQKEPAASALSGRPISAGAPALLQPAHAGAWGVRGGEQDGDLEPAATAPDRSRAARAEDGRAEVLPQLVRCPDAPDPEHTPGRSGKDARSEEGSGPSQAEHVSSAPSAGHPQQAQQQTRQQQQPQHQQHQQPQHQHQQHQQHHQQQQQPAQQKGRGRDPGWDFDVEGGGSWWLDRSELLANSLTHLALVVDGLNSKDHGFELALFAGRRSSDRLFLVLQTLVFSRLVRGYMGISSLFVATLLEKAWDRVGMPTHMRKAQLGRLVGTHAHEQSMLVQQLLAHFDQQAGDVARLHGTGPVNITSLVAHLLHFAANGGLSNATALPDTFGTAAFVAVATTADVPPLFSQHMAAVHREDVQEGAKCFDLFRVWRIDSGDYLETAELVWRAWEERRKLLMATGKPDTLPQPQFINSDLKDVEQILKLADLPAHLRPRMLAFGSLADGFLPFPKPPHSHAATQQGSMGLLQLEQDKQGHSHQHAEYPNSAVAVGISLGSIVMKAVQGYVCGRHSSQASALKLGDDPKEGKLILDPRMLPCDRPALLTQARAMAGVRPGDVDGPIVSKVLAEAYEAGSSRFKDSWCK